MKYFISYKETLLGGPLTKQEAEAKLIRLGNIFINLKIVKVDERPQKWTKYR